MFAQYDLFLHESALFCFGQCCECSQGVHARFFDHGREPFVSGVVPRKDWEVGTLGVIDGVFGEARISDEPAFINALFRVGSISEIVVASVHIEGVLNIGFASRIVVEFGFNTNSLALTLCEHIDLMRGATAAQNHIRPYGPAVRVQYLRKKKLERKPRWAERKHSTLHAISCGNGRNLLLSK